MSLVSCQHQRLLGPEMPSACSSHAGRLAWSPTLALGLPSVFASGLGLLLFVIITISNLPERSDTEVWGWRVG